MMRLAIIVLLTTAFGCATITSKISTTITSRGTFTVMSKPTSSTVSAVVTVEGSYLQATLMRKNVCVVETNENLLHQDYVEREANNAIYIEYGLATLLSVMGTLYLAVPRVSEKHDDPALARALGGWGGIAGGVACLTAGIVDSVRAKDGLGPTDLRKKLVDRNSVPCGSEPARMAEVSWRESSTGETGTIGFSDAAGQLSVDLAPLLPSTLFARPDPVRSIELLVAGQLAGNADVGDIAEATAAAAYREAGKLGTLAAYKSALAKFAWSTHRGSAEAAIEAAMAEREAADWAEAKKGGLEGYSNYLRVHRRGVHAGAALEQIVRAFIARGSYDEARRYAATAASVNMSATAAAALVASVEQGQQAEKRRIASAVTQAHSVAKGCGADVDANRAVAANAYRLLSAVHGKLPEAQFMSAAKGIQATCRVSAAGAGVSW